MIRGFVSVVGTPALGVLLAACVGPQYDATPDFGEDASGEEDAEREAGADADAEPCPDLAPRDDDVGAARVAFEHGISAYVGGRYADAALAFCRAYAAHPAYQIWFNIAKCEAELGNAGRAVAAYERFLDEGADRIPEDLHQKVFGEIARLRRDARDGE